MAFQRGNKLSYRDPILRFWEKFDMRGDEECWTWLASSTRNGRGEFFFCGRIIKPYRFLYELLRGPIPEGLVLDHLCRVPACVNPWHMEAVTLKENILRGSGPTAVNGAKTHCKLGHPYDDENTVYPSTGGRRCGKCQLAVNRRALKALREAA